jgi:hypothetical protein
MILKGSQRAGGKQLGLHLLRLDENDHVEVHQVRGFISANVVNALREAYAISRGTKCTQFLFSLSLSPPQKEVVPVPVFEKAIDEVEERLGLSGQPRVIVFHEKNGRRHAHCVWSRINPKTLKAINLPHYKFRLQEMSRELYIRYGWEVPRGLLNSRETNPLNFSREEWQQANRITRDPKHIKQIFQDCWAVSDSASAFQRALEARGYYLAQGDRRGHVAIDWTGEIYSLSRWVGVSTKELRNRLGDPAVLPSVDAVRHAIAEQVGKKLHGFSSDAVLEFDEARLALKAKRDDLVTRQRNERQFFYETQAARWVEETRTRAERYRKGLRGIWDRVTGQHRKTREQNEAEVSFAKVRDQREREELILRQLAERRELQSQVAEIAKRREREAELWQREISGLAQVPAISVAPKPAPRRRRTLSPSL